MSIYFENYIEVLSLIPSLTPSLFFLTMDMQIDYIYPLTSP